MVFDNSTTNIINIDRSLEDDDQNLNLNSLGKSLEPMENSPDFMKTIKKLQIPVKGRKS